MPSAKKSTMDGLDLFTAWRRFVSRCAFLLTAVRTIHVSWTFLCPPLCSISFCWQCKVSNHDSVIWLPIGFVMLFSYIFQSDLDSWQRSFLHCCLFVMVCNEWSIATNEVQWPAHFSVCDGLLGCALQLPLPIIICGFAFTFLSDWIHVEKFLLHL